MRHARCWTVLASITLVAVLGGCQDQRSTPTELDLPSPSLQTNGQVSPGTGQGRGRPHEEQAIELAARIPGLGGYFFDPSGDLVVYLTDSGQAEVAEAALASVLQGRRASGHARAAANPQIVVHQAKYSFLQLSEWRDRMTDPVLDIPGVIFTDLTESENRLTIAVQNAWVRGHVENKLAILGIPMEAVLFTQADSVESLARIGPSAERFNSVVSSSCGPQITDRCRPLVGGIKIVSVQSDGQLGQCTIGFIADVAGTRSFITNSHCTATFWGLDGRNVFQAQYVDADFVGQEFRDPAGQSCGFLSPNKCRYSDATAIRINSGIASDRGYIARTKLDNGPVIYSLEIDPNNPRFRITGDSPPTRYDIMDHVGITTGWTKGVVEYTCIDTRHLQGSNIRLRCQDLATYGAERGDSGGPTFKWYTNGTVTLNGIIWGKIYYNGGYYIASSSIGNIQNDLGSLGALTPESSYTPPPSYDEPPDCTDQQVAC